MGIAVYQAIPGSSDDTTKRRTGRTNERHAARWSHLIWRMFFKVMVSLASIISNMCVKILEKASICGFVIYSLFE